MASLAVPARRGQTMITQPDGSTVTVFIRGDERSHVMTTADGCAVTMCRDGWLHYLRFDPDGCRTDTGVRATMDADAAVVAASRSIPFAALRRQAASSRVGHNLTSLSGRYPEMVTRADSKPVYRAIIILAQFSDLAFTYGRDCFEDMVNKTGYSLNGASGSCLDYFRAQFGDNAEFSFEVGPVVTLPKGYAYYGKDDSKGEDQHPEEAVAEACRLSDADVDFSLYDYVFMFYAGGNPADGGADDDHIWPHSWDLVEAGIRLVLDGKRISTYSCTSELMNTGSRTTKLEFAAIGTFCHEYGHAIGLPDMYDTDYEDSGGEADGLWYTTSIMDGGSYNNNGRTPPYYNSVEQEILGLLDVETLAKGDVTLESVGTTHKALKLESGTEGEYFLFEARQALGWDKYIGGSGLLAYHIDRSSGAAGYSTFYERVLKASERWDLNEVNCRPDHECAALVPTSSSASYVSEVFFPSSSVTTLSSKENSAYRYWDGTVPLLSLGNLKKTNGVVTFTVNGPLALDAKDEFQDAVILSWHTDLESCADLPAWVTWQSDGVDHEVQVAPYGDGRYSYTIEGLSPESSYSIRISYRTSGAEGGDIAVPVTTKALSGLPFIYLASASRNSQGKFTSHTRIPLRMWNLSDVMDVEWYWDGRQITAGDDGYYELSSDGTLKAVVTYRNGTEEIFTKTITLR